MKKKEPTEDATEEESDLHASVHPKETGWEGVMDSDVGEEGREGGLKRPGDFKGEMRKEGMKGWHGRWQVTLSKVR